ncbi:MAG: hypothetical protein H7X84_01510 [Verrucomicrobia bacterium]|nr:hypothetical protein [Prolixibacteraceae bacterium]
MIKDNEISRSCFYYDMFIERAYGTYEPDIPGCHAHKIEALIMAEKEKDVSVEFIADFEEQLIEIKRCMEEALDMYLAMTHVPKEIINELKHTQEQVVYAVSSDELMKIVYKTIDLTVSVPLDMK